MNSNRATIRHLAVRLCESVVEFREMIQLQRHVWNYSDVDVVPSHLFVVAAESGGQVLGAFLEEKLVGFTLAYAGEKNGKPYLHSHLAAVLPEFRDCGVGRQLKITQRLLALDRGIGRIEWTFDPLQSRNAYFNMCRLGATCRRYLPDLYGTTSSPLHASLPTDRLLAEWHLNSPSVRHILANEQTALPSFSNTIEIPLDIAKLNSADSEILQSNVRASFNDLFSRNYAVTWFERRAANGVYLLEPSGDILPSSSAGDQ